MTTPKSGDVYQVMNKPTPAKEAKGGSVVGDKKLRSPTVHMIPETAACEGTTTISLVFDEIPEALMSGSGRVEVSVQSKEKIDRVVAKHYNRRTFSFTAPENRDGDARVVVFINGTEVTSCYLRYRSDTVPLVAGLSQIYLQFLSTICRYMYNLQTKHQIPSPMPELDRLLAKFFDDKDGTHNIPLRAFEELFDILRHSSTDAIQSKYEFPTLLHLSGEYGLEQLAARLMDLPGATRAANNVVNHNKRTASDMARNNGHLNLSKTLGSPTTVVVRSNSVTPTRNSKVNTLLPETPRSGPKPVLTGSAGTGGDYVLPDCITPVADFEDNYTIIPQQQQQRKQPPPPCQKFVGLQRKSVPASIQESESEIPTPLSRSSSETGAPPLPRRESRDSGVHDDGNDGLLPPPPTTRRPRPPLTKGESEPVYVYDKEGHYVAGRRSSQDAVGSTMQRSPLMSGQEIARQLMKPVHPQPGTRGPSVTK